MESEGFVGTIVVSDKKHKDLFRIHVFENSIQFDRNFAEGIIQNTEIISKVSEIEKLWKDRKIQQGDIFYNIVSILEKHEGYLSQFYFRREELDEQGRFKENLEITPNLGNIENIQNHLDGINPEKKVSAYLNYLKNNNKLNKISRKEFEKHLKNKEVIDYYLDNYGRRKASFYTYKITRPDKMVKDCYMMVIQDKIRIAFHI